MNIQKFSILLSEERKPLFKALSKVKRLDAKERQKLRFNDWPLWTDVSR